jgi:hypothetical protein
MSKNAARIPKKQIKAEILKSGRDPVYFINNYVKTVHPVRGAVPFKTYPFQTELLKEFQNNRYNIILKARQLGISTLSASYILWMMLFSQNKNILVIATKLQTAGNLVRKVKQMMNSLPSWMRIASIKIDNRTSFELSNGSQIKASATSADAGRSEALSLLVIDEAAHIENMDELWAGLYPTISTGGRVIALSSPMGVGNWFHKMCVGAENSENDFFLTTLPWDVHPERDDNWFKKETNNLPQRKIAQEYLCSFNASGETVVHADDLTFYEKKVEIPKYKSGFDRNYWIWKEAEKGKNYLISADVARGDGRDHSAFHVIDVEEMDIVAEYCGKPSIDLFATFLQDVAREYGNPLLVVENNNIGYAVLEKLIEAGYPNLYFSIKGSGEYIDSFTAETRTGSVPGFSTSHKTRPLIIAKLEEFIRNKLLNIKSNRLVQELRTFVWNNGRPEAMKGYNDDLTMSLAIACWVRDTAIVQGRRNDDFKRALIGGIMSTRSGLDVRVPGQRDYNRNADLQRKARQAAKQQEQFSWVYKG